MIDFGRIHEDRVFAPPWDERQKAEVWEELRWRRAAFGNAWAYIDRRAGTVTVSIVPPTPGPGENAASAASP